MNNTFLANVPVFDMQGVRTSCHVSCGTVMTKVLASYFTCGYRIAILFVSQCFNL